MHLQMTVVWADGGRGPLEVLVDAPAGATVADLRRALQRHVGPHLAEGQWRLRAAGTPVRDTDAVGEGALLDGAVLTVLPGGGDQQAPGPGGGHGSRPGHASPLTLAVVSGPDAGREFTLASGSVRVGRGSGADLTVADPDLSRTHALLTVGADGVHVADHSSTNGTRVDGRPVPDQGLLLSTSETVAMGSSRFRVRTPHRQPAAVTAARDGTRLVNRSPRMARQAQPATFTIPAAPPRPHRPRLPWVAMLVPLPIGVVLALLFSPAMLAFALMTPALMGATAITDRVHGRRSYAAQLAEHEAAVRRVRACAAVAVAEERRARQRVLPDPAEVLALACTPSTRLWERRRSDPDVLELRLGTWTARAQVRLVSAGQDAPPEHLEAPDSPCAVPLGTLGVLGIAGPAAQTAAVGRSLVGQVAALHSPRDVDIWLLAARRADCAAWQWLSRLPHSRVRDTQRRVACLETGESAVAAAVQELRVAVDQRRQQRQPGQPWTGERTLVILAGAGLLREQPGVAGLLEHGPPVGLVFLALDEEAGRLPSESGAVVEALTAGTKATRWRLTTHGDPQGHSLVVDQVGSWWADRLSRALAPLRDSTPEDTESGLPHEVGLLDLLPFDARDPHAVQRQWAAQPATTQAPVGVAAGATHTIDLRRDGPHILVGGTTGSGKSEFLRTLVAGLAAGNRPDRLAFVLVDYKGGAAFGECAALPHTTGLVTDLDAHLTARALISLGAELRRREALFASVGARDLDDWERRRGSEHPSVPRLVIVIDEFRVLAEEFPDFIAGLVRVAAVGRSLGVHLVLATQRPAGVVSADIKANVSLRVALRVRDRADSDDVIDSPAAASISEAAPGRAFARSGSEPPQLFQTARVAGAASSQLREAPLSVLPIDWAAGPPKPPAVQQRRGGDPGDPRAGASPDRRDGRDHPDDSDLSVLVTSLGTAAAAMAIAPVAPPWLPPLPEHLTADNLPAVDALGEWVVPLGLADRPAEQRQEPLLWDLAEAGHWAAVGTTGSGRTGFLRLVAGAAARRLTPAQLHLYAVDGALGGLRGLTSLPHTGAVVSRDDRARLERLVRRLEAEVDRRQHQMSRHGHSSLANWRAAAARDSDTTPPPPATMLLLVDDWDLVVHELDAADHGLLSDRLVTLLRVGAAVGLRAAVTGDRAVLCGRTASLFARRLVLRLAEPGDVVLAGLGRDALPTVQPPGRAVAAPDGTVVQLAEPPALATVPAGTAEQLPPPLRPLRVEPLPAQVDLDGLGPVGELRAGQVTVGIGGDDLRPVGLDPHRDGGLWLVAGTPRSGKSTALRTLATSLLRAGRQVALVTTRPGPLDGLRGIGGVVCWASPDDVASLESAHRRDPDLAVLVDDADQLLDTPVEPVLRDLARAARQGSGLVTCSAGTSTLLTQYRGVAVEVARSQTGLLLGARGVGDAELFGLPGRGPAPADRVPGRGLLVTAAATVEVQVATVAEPARASQTA